MMADISKAISNEYTEPESLNSKILLGLKPEFEACPLLYSNQSFEEPPEPSYGIGQKFNAARIIRTKPWDVKTDREKFYFNRDTQTND